MIFSLHFNSTSVQHANNALNLVCGEQFIYSVTSKCKKKKSIFQRKTKINSSGPIFHFKYNLAEWK